MSTSQQSNTSQAIHECVYGSIIRHVLKLSPDSILEYLTKYPFYRGADTLYYFLLKRIGKDAYYAADGRHLISIHPELMGVYILAESDVNAPVIRDVPEKTVYPMIKAVIDRTITCERYQLRHSIIIGEADTSKAKQIPSIALNIPTYQAYYQSKSEDLNVVACLIENDCWEAIKERNGNLLPLMISRMLTVKATLPNLWDLVLKEYYTQHLLRLKIYKMISSSPVKYITMLNTLLPDLIRLPPGLDTLGIRLWYAPRPTRAYLLGFDVSDGIPSDEIISERLLHLQNVGIESYADEITGVYIDGNGHLTGQIGMMTYPDLAGKKLLNTKDSTGVLLGTYYPYDLFPVIHDGNVVILTIGDIQVAVAATPCRSAEDLRAILENIDTLVCPMDLPTAKTIYARLTSPINAVRGNNARVNLVEIMSWDILNHARV